MWYLQETLPVEMFKTPHSLDNMEKINRIETERHVNSHASSRGLLGYEIV